ncbi:ABC transporter permease [Citricoccus sp. CH26A]|uniref:ABC transporter permease n=1 Tax=Citricoccus TaxID=169133 RepID=UPI001ED8D16E|nr:ABC transporter permease [Citricoccus sp. CH26A]
MGARPHLFRYIGQLFTYRHFVLFDARARVAGSSTNDSLGRLWMVLNPILNGATYFLVFGILLGTGRGIENFIGYLIIGVFMFRYTTSAVTSGSKSIVGNRAVIRAFSFPRATLPIAVNVRELLSNVPTFVMMFILILMIPPAEDISWTWLLFFPVLALQFIMNLGLSLFLARMVARWNDVTHLIAFGTRAWLYISAVFFSVERFEDTPLLIGLMHANPMFCVLDITRDALLYGGVGDPGRWLVLGGWALGSLVIGGIVFWQAEETYGRAQ